MTERQEAFDLWFIGAIDEMQKRASNFFAASICVDSITAFMAGWDACEKHYQEKKACECCDPSTIDIQKLIDAGCKYCSSCGRELSKKSTCKYCGATEGHLSNCPSLIKGISLND